jgi:hypothetical protein
MLDVSKILGAAELRNVEAVHRARIAAARAFDLESRLEADEIGSGSDVFRGHRVQLTCGEQEGNRPTCGNRAKRLSSEFKRLGKVQRVIDFDA